MYCSIGVWIVLDTSFRSLDYSEQLSHDELRVLWTLAIVCHDERLNYRSLAAQVIFLSFLLLQPPPFRSHCSFYVQEV